ncbi:fatty acyl-CoA reductase wat-like isoform X1 [Planococcus citri]|uniref:fatty acyl-CoA reductase wat-like isoform X1 n=2 Tax=Planococcus citri TaxID=170843 RepID=UPI0031F804CB
MLKKGQAQVDEYDAEILKRIITAEYPTDPLEILGERNFNPPRIVPKEEIGTPVQEFFRDVTVFITGGTGFVGKILTEKLLRSCPHLKHIYLLVRNKKGQTSDERINAIFQDRLYKRLKHECPDSYKKLSVMKGDLGEPELGLSDENKKKFAEEVNVVFHGAATVRFDEILKLAVIINVIGTRQVLKLAKRAKNLKAMMYISTAYSFCPHSEIEEKFYDMPADYIDVINKVTKMNDSEVNFETPKILGEWPNTYSFTKALAECVVKNESQDLPIGLFRPTIIISTYQEPVRGWIDNVYGPIGSFLAAITGILHVFEATYDKNCLDMVPVDLVINGLICATKATAEKYEKLKSEKKDVDIPVYIYSSGTQNPITYGEFEHRYSHFSLEWPTIKAVWYYSVIFTDNKYLFRILSFLMHTIPAYFLDFLSCLVGEKPVLTEIYEKMNHVLEITAYFRARHWVFKNNNIQELWQKLSNEDKQLFFFNMADFSWEYCLQAMGLGLRVYLVNDDIHTLPAARIKWRRLYYAHIALKTVFFAVLIFPLWSLLKFVLF